MKSVTILYTSHAYCLSQPPTSSAVQITLCDPRNAYISKLLLLLCPNIILRTPYYLTNRTKISVLTKHVTKQF
jgi:hypothetical protein